MRDDERRRCQEAEGLTDADATLARQSDEPVVRAALELFYWWATFSPLSRGTAACGYAALCAVLLAFGKQPGPSSLLPTAKQLDWEAILASDFEGFYTQVKGWFKLTDASPQLLVAVGHPWATPEPRDDAAAQAEGLVVEPAVGCIRTLRDMLDTLCLPFDQ